jgi:hypothetical protein
MTFEEKILQSMCLHGKISQEHADEIREIIKQALQKQKERIVKGLPKKKSAPTHSFGNGINAVYTITGTEKENYGWNSCLEEVIKSIKHERTK